MEKNMTYHEETDTWILNDIIDGEITYREDYGICVKIDNKELSMGEFQRAIGVYEGFKFRLEFIDPTL